MAYCSIGFNALNAITFSILTYWNLVGLHGITKIAGLFHRAKM